MSEQPSVPAELSTEQCNKLSFFVLRVYIIDNFVCFSLFLSCVVLLFTHDTIDSNLYLS